MRATCCAAFRRRSGSRAASLGQDDNFVSAHEIDVPAPPVPVPKPVQRIRKAEFKLNSVAIGQARF
jgi:hypothetical protein